MAYFDWLPPSYFMLEDFSRYPQNVLITTALVNLVITGIIAPWVEELYFRGYLLPKISWVKGFSPVFEALFFTLYHFWSPWSLVSRFLAVLPMVAVVWWKKDLRLSIWVHCLVNTLSGVMLLVEWLRL